MILFAQTNAITLASDDLYMSAKQLQHSMRASKATKGLVVTDTDLIDFPKNIQSSVTFSTVQVDIFSI